MTTDPANLELLNEADQSGRIDALAALLAKNHLDLSVQRLEDTDADDEEIRMAIGRRAFRDEYVELARKGSRRTVVLVGAGVSADAFGTEAYPIASAAMNEVSRILGHDPNHANPGRHDDISAFDKQDLLARQVSRAKERLVQFYGYERARIDLETHLAVLADIFGEKEVRTAIASIFKDKHRPHLTFELLAHLLKHRFVDAIINFNFDELLDQAIEEEVGEGQYQSVFSDGHCQPLDDIAVDRRLKVPLHIKPHGTASHASSLRFTKDHYDQLPGAMQRFLRDIVCGHRESEKGDGGALRLTRGVTVVSIGFGMESIDLNRILAEAAHKHGMDGVVVFHINLSRAFGEDEDGNKSSLHGDVLKAKTGIPRRNHVQIEVGTGAYPGYADVLHEVWRRVQDVYVPALKPRGVRRHEIIHTLFYRSDTSSRVPAARERQPGTGGWAGGREADYAYARLCTELALALARGNGILDIGALENGRVGRYARYLVERYKKGAEIPRGSGTARPDYQTPLETAIRAFGRHGIRIEPGRRFTRRVLDATFTDPVAATDPDAFAVAIAGKIWTALRGVLKEIDPDLSTHIDTIDQAEMRLWLQRLASSDTRTINADFQPSALLLSRVPSPDAVLHTNLSVGLRFIRMLEGDWDLLLAVSNFGKIMDRYNEHADAMAVPPISERKFALVVAEFDHKEVVQDRLDCYRDSLLGPASGPGAGTESFYRVPFWASRRQMVVTMKLNDGGPVWGASNWPLQPVEAIEFLGAARARATNPVWTTEPSDLERLVDTFFGYVVAADRYVADGGVPSIGIDQARGARRTLLAHWAKEYIGATPPTGSPDSGGR